MGGLAWWQRLVFKYIYMLYIHIFICMKKSIHDARTTSTIIIFIHIQMYIHIQSCICRAYTIHSIANKIYISSIFLYCIRSFFCIVRHSLNKMHNTIPKFSLNTHLCLCDLTCDNMYIHWQTYV